MITKGWVVVHENPHSTETKIRIKGKVYGIFWGTVRRDRRESIWEFVYGKTPYHLWSKTRDGSWPEELEWEYLSKHGWHCFHITLTGER